jgi:hypothetical protein
MSDGGKGSSPRPFSVNREEYDKRWDAIFGRDKKNKSLVDEKEKLPENQNQKQEKTD